MPHRTPKRGILLVLLTLLAALGCRGQEGSTLRIVLLDQDSASVPHAVIRIRREGGPLVREVAANQPKDFLVPGIGQGRYLLEIEAPGFKAFAGRLEIGPGDAVQTVRLSVEEIHEDVQVDQEALERTLGEVFNRVWTIDEIEALPNTPEEMEEELKRRYGEDILIKVNGFSGGRLPPKEQIAAIKIIRSSFDAEFHDIGHTVADVRTKAGIPKAIGFVRFSFGDESLNARNAFAPVRLPEQSRALVGYLGLPLAKKKTSATVSLLAVSGYSQKSIVASVPGRETPTSAKGGRASFFPSVGIDHNLSEHRTIHLEYQFQREVLTNLGVGNLNLAETGFSRRSAAHVFRASGLALIRRRFVNEFRAELKDGEARNRPNMQTPSVVTLNTFVAGGAGVDNSSLKRKVYGADNLLLERGSHSLKFGGEVEAERSRSLSADATNGAFLFATLADYLAGRPAVYTKRRGIGSVTLNQLQTSAYAQDDIRLGRNMMAGLGLRYEWQNSVKDCSNFSPRLSLTFSPSNDGKIVFRGGAGVFYRWLDAQNLATILGNDGRQASDLIIINPDFPVPSPDGRSPAPSVMSRAEDLANPYVFVTQSGFNYRVAKKLNVEAFYKFERGVHQFRSRDSNAPLNGRRPNPLYGRVSQLESNGTFKASSLEIRVEGRLFKEITLSSRYKLSKAVADFDGMFDLPVDNYDLSLEKGFSSLDRRHSLAAGWNILLLRRLRVTPVLRLESPLPYTVTTGMDDNGDTVFNDRPVGSRRNGERGAWFKQADLRLDWQLPFNGGERVGNESQGAPSVGLLKKCVVGMDVTIQNIFNNMNAQNYVGNRLSPFYRRATSAAPARQIQVGLSVHF